MSIDSPTQLKRRRTHHYSALEKQRFVEETYRAGHSVSSVARTHGLTPSALYRWRRLMEEGALTGINSKDGVVDK